MIRVFSKIFNKKNLILYQSYLKLIFMVFDYQIRLLLMIVYQLLKLVMMYVRLAKSYSLCYNFYHFVESLHYFNYLLFLLISLKTYRNKLYLIFFVKCIYIILNHLKHLILPDNQWFLFLFVYFNSLIVVILMIKLMKDHWIMLICNFIVKKKEFIIYQL